MKHFYGTVRGSGGTSTNSGTMSSGLRVEAHSKQGTVVVQLSENSGIDHAKVYLTRNPLTGKGTERVLYDGAVAGYSEPDIILKFPSKRVREVMLPDPEILTGPELLVMEGSLPAVNFDPPVKLPSDQQITAAIVGFFNLPIQRRTHNLIGSLDPTGDEMDSEWINDAKEARGPSRPAGKLTLLPDESD